jgi:hypothetical protein
MAKGNIGEGLASIVLDASRSSNAGPRNVVDIIEFIESPWGLGMTLFPVQKVILKVHYGLELDDTHKFQITDFRRQNARMVTEKEYLAILYDEGRCNVREVTPGQERREMVLSIGRRSGKCIKEGTLILTDKGISKIEDLGDPNGLEYQPLEITVAQEGKGVQAQSAYFYNGGIRDTIKFTTGSGYSLEGTPNHRVKVLIEDGTVQWKYLEDIKLGDQICIHRNTDLWSNNYVYTGDIAKQSSLLGRKSFDFPDFLNEDWALLLGLLVGDGSWTCKTGVALTVGHPENIESFSNLFNKTLGDAVVTPDKRNSVVRLSCDGISARDFLHQLGWDKTANRYKKEIPWSILKSPKTVIKSFLKGLFETDGGVEKAGQVVSFSTASQKLAEQVQLLLLNLGIVSKVKNKKIKKYPNNIYYTVTILGLRSRKLFASDIGFISQRKMQPLLDSIQSASKEGGDTESIPNQQIWVQKLLNSVPKNAMGAGWSRTTLREVLGNVCKPSSGENLTYDRLAKILPVAEHLGADKEILSHFKGIQALDYFYTPVTHLEAGKTRVYDLNIPEGSQFVAQGMTNHNTTISAAISAYETYKLISKGDPQAYYGLPASNNIQLISIATDKDQAGLLYQEVSGHFKRCAFFAPYNANNTMSYARFQSPKDIERYGAYSQDPSAKATIKITFRSCVAKGLRGAGNIVVILDEAAHFTDGGQSSAEAVYNAVTPSTSAYSAKDPKNPTKPVGPVEGRIISISSPLGRQGQFYKLFSLGMRGGAAAENMLCIQAPTWEVNPTVPASEFEKHYMKDPAVFFTEYGGEFTDRTRGWIEKSEDLTNCINVNLRPQVNGVSRSPYFLGLDLGLVGDGTAVAIGHLNKEGKIIVDLVEQIKAGEGRYREMERLDFDAVADWILELSKKFYITEGIFDQWAGIPLEQALAKRGLKQFKAMQMTKIINSDMYRNFKNMMWDNRLELYDFPKENGSEHCSYIQELLELQAEQHTKYIISVEAPKVEGKHDDRADALARMIWIASQKLSTPTYFAKPSGYTSSNSVLSRNREIYTSQRRSGSHPDRLIPRTKSRKF